jgi:hypothetical protein
MPIDWKKLKAATDYAIIVYDNYHHGDSSEAYVDFGYRDPESALAKCREIIEICLAEEAEPGLDAHAIYNRYTMFGDDPAISSPTGAPEVIFSGWVYAKENAARFVKPAVRAN